MEETICDLYPYLPTDFLYGPCDLVAQKVQLLHGALNATPPVGVVVCEFASE